MAKRLSERGFRVVNVDYPSTSKPIEELAPLAVEQGLSQCEPGEAIHFVTHSLGGILVRYYLERHGIDGIHRVVMLAPPNQGSEVVDDLRDLPGFVLLNGPAGLQLGTGPDSVPRRLGPVGFELGVIAGNESVNPLLSRSLPDPDDGKVSVESTRVEGMRDFLLVPHSHTFIMRSVFVIEQTIHFLRNGSFDHGTSGPASHQ